MRKLINKLHCQFAALHRDFASIIVKLIVRFIVKYKGLYFYHYGRYWVKNIQKKGEDLRIHGPITILGQDYLEIGDYVRIGYGCFFCCLGGLKIGSNTQISRNVCIYTANHNYNAKAIPYDDTYLRKSVEIGSSVWIGMNVCITPGVKIGDGAIIGMGAVVASDVPPGAIVVGAKTRIIGGRDLDAFNEATLSSNLFGKL